MCRRVPSSPMCGRLKTFSLRYLDSTSTMSGVSVLSADP